MRFVLCDSKNHKRKLDFKLREKEKLMAEEELRGLDRELVCVLFPGVVKNDEKALQCLGGLKVISQVYSFCTIY